jgi:hypothetical protein
MQPDATPDELRAWMFASHGVSVSQGGMWKCSTGLDLTLKERRNTPPSRDGPMSARPAQPGARFQPSMNAGQLVFLDETWATTNMTRRYGRAPRGERVIARVPHGHWKTFTFVAGLRDDAITAPLVIDGAMNGETFRAYIEQFLAPTLAHGDIVIMDNLPSHKVAAVREANCLDQLQSRRGSNSAKSGRDRRPRSRRLSAKRRHLACCLLKHRDALHVRPDDERAAVESSEVGDGRLEIK